MRAYEVDLRDQTIVSRELEKIERHTVYFVEDGKSHRRNRTGDRYCYFIEEDAAYIFLSRYLESRAQEIEGQRQVMLRRKTEVDAHLEAMRAQAEVMTDGYDGSSYGLPSPPSTSSTDETSTDI